MLGPYSLFYPVESSEILIKKILVKWIQFTILKFFNQEERKLFRLIEKLQEKVLKLQTRICFNQTCLQHKLLPTYINIYNIHIYTVSSKSI